MNYIYNPLTYRTVSKNVKIILNLEVENEKVFFCRDLKKQRIKILKIVSSLDSDIGSSDFLL